MFRKINIYVIHLVLIFLFAGLLMSCSKRKKDEKVKDKLQISQTDLSSSRIGSKVSKTEVISDVLPGDSVTQEYLDSIQDFLSEESLTTLNVETRVESTLVIDSAEYVEYQKQVEEYQKKADFVNQVMDDMKNTANENIEFLSRNQSIRQVKKRATELNNEAELVREKMMTYEQDTPQYRALENKALFLEDISKRIKGTQGSQKAMIPLAEEIRQKMISSNNEED